ncbi:MAG: thiamine phosphate synthase [Opitutales bacterium]
MPDEPAWIERLLRRGLSRYHVRKPAWSEARLRELVAAIPEELRARIVLHQHHGLVSELGLGGRHVKDGPADSVAAAFYSADADGSSTISRSLHAIDTLETELRGWDYIILSPVFPSISKQGYRPRWTIDDVKREVGGRNRNNGGKIYALGGIDSGNVGCCGSLGFDGAVLHGALWQSSNPVDAFEQIKEAAA